MAPATNPSEINPDAPAADPNTIEGNVIRRLYVEALNLVAEWKSGHHQIVGNLNPSAAEHVEGHLNPVEATEPNETPETPEEGAEASDTTTDTETGDNLPGTSTTTGDEPSDHPFAQ